MYLGQIQRLERDQPVFNGIVQVTIFSFPAVSCPLLRLAALVRVTVIPLFQNASLQTELSNIRATTLQEARGPVPLESQPRKSRPVKRLELNAILVRGGSRALAA